MDEDSRDVLVSLTTHESRINELYHRLKMQEQESKAISDLALGVNELTVTMKSMLEEQKSQGERITRLERAPLARYETVICAIISALFGAAISVISKLL
jgi:hypothetical protein